MIYITAILGAVFTLAVYKIGLSDGMRISAGEKVPVLKMPRLRRSKSSISETEYNTILSNIENYDGTSKGQKEIKK